MKTSPIEYAFIIVVCMIAIALCGITRACAPAEKGLSAFADFLTKIIMCLCCGIWISMVMMIVKVVG